MVKQYVTVFKLQLKWNVMLKRAGIDENSLTLYKQSDYFPLGFPLHAQILH